MELVARYEIVDGQRVEIFAGRGEGRQNPLGEVLPAPVVRDPLRVYVILLAYNPTA